MKRKLIVTNKFDDKHPLCQFLSVPLWVVIVIACFVLALTDPFHITNINTFAHFYNTSTGEVMYFKDIKSEYHSYDDVEYDYAKELRYQDIVVTGWLEVQEFKFEDDRYFIEGRAFDLFSSPNVIALWIPKEEISEHMLSEIKIGTGIEFKAYLNGINDTYLILNQGEVKLK